MWEVCPAVENNGECANAAWPLLAGLLLQRDLPEVAGALQNVQCYFHIGRLNLAIRLQRESFPM